jgi:hypothetical protein
MQACLHNRVHIVSRRRGLAWVDNTNGRETRRDLYNMLCDRTCGRTTCEDLDCWQHRIFDMRCSIISLQNTMAGSTQCESVQESATPYAEFEAAYSWMSSTCPSPKFGVSFGAIEAKKSRLC